MPAGHDHDHGGHVRASWLGHLATNWRAYDASFTRKLGLTARNLTWGRLRHGVCCGHHGQPGC